MQTEDVSSVDSQRTIDIYWYERQFLLVIEVVKYINNLLCSSDCECWNNKFAFLFHAGMFDDSQQLIFRELLILMQSVAVCTFHDEIVALREGVGSAEQVVVVTTYVASVADTRHLTELIYLYCSRRTA